MMRLDVRHFEDQGSFPPCHLGLKAALVETSPQSRTANAVFTDCNERSATLKILVMMIVLWWRDVRRRHLRPDRGPTAR